MVEPSTTYRCAHCTQLLPFDEHIRVPDACLRRCQGQCDWVPVGPTRAAVRRAATRDGPLGPDGLPAADGANATTGRRAPTHPPATPRGGRR